MDSFNYYMPTRLIFGVGTLEDLATTPYFPWKKALVVIGAGGAMRRLGILGRVQNLLAARGVDVVVYDKVKPNPEVDQVEEGAGIARQEQCDVVVGLGGGSTIDSAKSIAVLAKNPALLGLTSCPAQGAERFRSMERSPSWRSRRLPAQEPKPTLGPSRPTPAPEKRSGGGEIAHTRRSRSSTRN